MLDTQLPAQWNLEDCSKKTGVVYPDVSSSLSCIKGVDINLPSLITSPLLRGEFFSNIYPLRPLSQNCLRNVREKNDTMHRFVATIVEDETSLSPRLRFGRVRFKTEENLFWKTAATLVISSPFFFSFLFPPAWDTREMINGGKTERRSHEERIARLSEYKPCRAR